MRYKLLKTFKKRNYLPDFQHYVKQIEAKAKNGFLIKKYVYFKIGIECENSPKK